LDAQRLDKWLWYARFFKSRSLATKFCASGRLRVNGAVVSKAHHRLKVDDVLTFPKARHIRVVRVAGLGARRGPAKEAQALYDDLQPPPSLSRPGNKPPGEPRSLAAAKRERGAGRPTKRERRETDRLRGEQEGRG
jgi:ribosome-associated heat shock protein Hsp15